MQGKLELIIGPMFSGKSTELIRRIRLYKIIKKKVLVIKPKIDNRYYENKITSHNFETADCNLVSSLSELTNIKDYNYIIIDEGQFFNDLKKQVVYWLENYNVNIIITGLDGDFEKNPIGQILELIPHAEKCTKVNSLCNMCNDGTEGCFTFRTAESKNKILIGGVESYIPVCRKHYYELQN
jgi:thymidine kinase